MMTLTKKWATYPSPHKSMTTYLLEVVRNDTSGKWSAHGFTVCGMGGIRVHGVLNNT